MFSFTHMISYVSAALVVASVSSVTAVPILTQVATQHVARAAPPRNPFVVYTDRFVSAEVLPPAAQLAGFNVVALSFLTAGRGPLDQAAAFAALAPAARAAKKAEYAAAGISIIASAFGETEKPTTDGIDPIATAATFSAFVKANALDGIDVDYEDLAAINKGDGVAEKWVADFTTALRTALPQGQFILSHAPLAPWFSVNPQFAAGAYLTVHKQVGNLIDFYNLQFYNQGQYFDCTSLISTSGPPFAGSSVLEIMKAGIPGNKIVIGKPGSAADAANGFMDPATLGTCVTQAANGGWDGGIMAFQFPSADAAWIKAAKGPNFV